jgi:hypothetical protein
MRFDISLRLAGMGALLRIGRKIMADIQALADEIAGLKSDVEGLRGDADALIETTLGLAAMVEDLLNKPDDQAVIDAARDEVVAARALVAGIRSDAVAAEDAADNRLEPAAPEA